MVKRSPQWSLHGMVLLAISGIMVIGIVAFVVLALVSRSEDMEPEIVLGTSGTSEVNPDLNEDDLASPSAVTKMEKTDHYFDLGIHVQEIQSDVNPDVMRGYLEAAADQLHLNWVRVEMRWDFIESETGSYKWGAWDTFFQTAQRYDLKVLVTVTGTPAWARPFGADLSLQGPPAEAAELGNFVRVLLNRYPGQIHAIEIWNGMNLRQQWDSPTGLNGTDYVQLFSAAAAAARQVNPDIIMISGGLLPTGSNDGVNIVDNFAYMDAMIGAGLLDIADCIGAQHTGYNIGAGITWDQVPSDENAVYRGPFESPHPSWSFASTMTTYANKIAVAGSTVPLCVTEFGWAVSSDVGGYAPGFEFAQDNTLQEQQQWVVGAIHLMENWDVVWLAFVWNMNAGPEALFNPLSEGVTYSLIRPGYSLSPAWQALAEMDFRSRIHP